MEEDIAIRFEAQLVSASMTASGGHKITLRIAPDDIMDNPANSPLKSMHNQRVRALMLQQPNTRFACALVQMADESDEPVEPQDVVDAKKVASTLSMLCRTDEDMNNAFRNWIVDKYPKESAETCVTFADWDERESGEQALAIIKYVHDFSSRKDLFENPELVRKIAGEINDYRNG